MRRIRCHLSAVSNMKENLMSLLIAFSSYYLQVKYVKILSTKLVVFSVWYLHENLGCRIIFYLGDCFTEKTTGFDR